MREKIEAWFDKLEASIAARPRHPLKVLTNWIAPIHKLTSVVAVVKREQLPGAAVPFETYAVMSEAEAAEALSKATADHQVAQLASRAVETRAICTTCERVRCLLVGGALVGLLPAVVHGGAWWLVSPALLSAVLVAKSTDSAAGPAS